MGKTAAFSECQPSSRSSGRKRRRLLRSEQPAVDEHSPMSSLGAARFEVAGGPSSEAAAIMAGLG